MKPKIIILILILTVPLLSYATEECLDCHSKRDILIIFEDGKSISGYVDSEMLRLSVHSSFDCKECHRDIDEKRHPEKKFRNQEQFRIKTALLCRRCHTSEIIKQKAVHEHLFLEEEKGTAHPCTNCHDAHGVKPVKKKIFKDEDLYCMSCHQKKVILRFKNGETATISVKMEELQSSVHRNLICSDCHFGFSSTSHPDRYFRSRRDYTIANADICRRCHFDKYIKVSESIHYSLLSTGRLEAPVCIDCHGFHSIQSMVKEKLLVAKKCQRCHGKIYETYVKSVHGNALINERNQDVPVCTDCHTSHDIKDPLTFDYRERIPDICSKCHSNASIMNKYGLSTDVVSTYLSDFHGLTIYLYRKEKRLHVKSFRPVAVCTDCHGTHDISSMGIQKSEIKKNILNKCRTCHPDASENFPDSWISHYGLSPDKTPLLYVLQKIYQLLIPLTIAGLAIQVVLHIWRYAVNR